MNESELVTGDEQSFSKQPLDVPQELNLVLWVSGWAMSLSALAPIPCLAWHYPSDAAPRIGNVTLSAWNDMNMSVHHGLSGCQAIIDADVEPIGL